MASSLPLSILNTIYFHFSLCGYDWVLVRLKLVFLYDLQLCSVVEKKLVVMHSAMVELSTTEVGNGRIVDDGRGWRSLLPLYLPHIHRAMEICRSLDGETTRN
ncbi:hypothetical protein Dsin_022483 [Dipteronia sinensis]|uniref:Uncharacterized protein n=1 Tax=Dipteronia sinensis TaxID=43782 RepID=A0AAE0A1U4_9ROSI|nr:hypothetical protein Dsin_022483 [Dipteronia sinensis]